MARTHREKHCIFLTKRHRLHFIVLERLLHVLNRLVDMGNTVVVIEHDMDVIKSSIMSLTLARSGKMAAS
jgi:excinuclease ABC subunit A